MAISKVVYKSSPSATPVVWMDTTQKTVTSASMLNGTTALKNDGTDITGNIATKTSSNLSASGATVTAEAGYYASAASKAVASGTEGTPTATKGTVSNHSVTVTPSVTNTAGYISGGSHTGTAVTVSASELASGNKSITSNGTNIDVVGYSTVSVSVSGGGGGGTSGIYTFDFTKGVTDEESGTLMFTLSGATQDSSGLHLTGASNEAFLSGINLNDHVVEVEVGSMTYNVASGHARFIMNGTDSGLIYRSTGYWQVYGYSWSAGSESSTTFFANSTVRIEYPTTGNRVTIYKDNVKCFDSVPFGPGAGTLYGIRFGSSAGASYFDATILKCTLYTNEAYALKILMGS